MRLLLRCDTGPSTGVGHAVRCAALAEQALAAGDDVFWSGRLDGLDWLWDGLDHSSPGTVLPPADDAASLAALARDIRADAVHVDHYLLGPELRDTLNPGGIVLSSVEDFHTGRRPADVVVDPNLGAAEHPRPDDGSPVLLRGPAYALLRASVRRARQQRENAPAADEPRVLVVMGGTDAGGLLPAVVDALAGTGVPADVDVVLPHGRSLELPARFHAVAPLPDLPGAAAGMDLVVSAAGTTVWELCCVGVPMALVRAADNQAEGYLAVTAAGAAAGLGAAADLTGPDAQATLRRLLTDPDARAGLAARARDVVDGLGASRVLDALRTATGTDRTLTTRTATEADAEMLLAWRNDPETRRWSRSPTPVEPSEHRAWLRGSLQNGHRLLVVVSDGDGPVGTVRWDHEPDGWEVSITVAPDRRGNGSGRDHARRGRAGAARTGRWGRRADRRRAPGQHGVGPAVRPRRVHAVRAGGRRRVRAAPQDAHLTSGRAARAPHEPAPTRLRSGRPGPCRGRETVRLEPDVAAHQPAEQQPGNRGERAALGDPQHEMAVVPVPRRDGVRGDRRDPARRRGPDERLAGDELGDGPHRRWQPGLDDPGADARPERPVEQLHRGHRLRPRRPAHRIGDRRPQLCGAGLDVPLHDDHRIHLRDVPIGTQTVPSGTW